MIASANSESGSATDAVCGSVAYYGYSCVGASACTDDGAEAYAKDDAGVYYYNTGSA